MRILLDTHVWLWMALTPDRLSKSVRRLVETRENELVLSAASTWEMAIKYRLGKLKLPGDPAAVAPEWMARSMVDPLPVLHSHALHVATLPLHHYDPFDRLLVAQAQLEDLTVLTADGDFELYDVTVKRA